MTMPWFKFGQIAGSFFWAGLVLGLSFIEAPLKFQAPGVTREIGLGIGRLVFGTLNRIEIVLTILLLSSLFFNHTSRIVRIFLTGVAVIVFTQTFWLLPTLDVRTQSILAGVEPGPSFHHHLFIVMEGLKVVLLILSGFLAARYIRIHN